LVNKLKGLHGVAIPLITKKKLRSSSLAFIYVIDWELRIIGRVAVSELVEGMQYYKMVAVCQEGSIPQPLAQHSLFSKALVGEQ
jgi:hypothetical protein